MMMKKRPLFKDASENKAASAGRYSKYIFNIYFILILFILVSAILKPSFVAPRHLINIARQAAPLGIVSIGQTLVMLLGGLDLSVGSVITLTNVLMGAISLGRPEMALPLLMLCLAMGWIIGSTNGVVNLGMPSYGRFNPPHQMGLSPLFSKPYFPGAHAYLVTPQGAGTLISQAHECAKPTDVFLHIDVFPWLQEYSPYIAEARDTFSTIQNENGIQAKHAFQKIGEKYKLI